MAGPQDPAAGGDRLRAGHADREQVIESLKDAFVDGRLTRDELSTRAGQALSARTYADLAALTADIPAIPVAPAATGRLRRSAPVPAPAPISVPARRWPLAKATARSGGCLVIAAAAVKIGVILDPDGAGPNPYHSWVPLCLFIALAAVIAATGFLGYGVVDSVEYRRSRRRLPPRPGPGGNVLEGERRGGTGQGAAPRRPRASQAPADQARADLRAHKPRPPRRHIPPRWAGHQVT